MNTSKSNFSSRVVALTTVDNDVMGTGWFITPTAVVTCNHVVTDAGFTGEPYSIGVRGHIPTIVEQHPDKDLAIIRVERSEVKPSLVSRDVGLGEELFSHGFDGNYSTKQWPNGHPMDVGKLSSFSVTQTVHGREQNFMVANGVVVDGGMSGSPVWSKSEHGIVGIVAKSDKEVNAYMIPVADLLDHWPEFESLHQIRPIEALAQTNLKPIEPDQQVKDAPGLPMRRPTIGPGQASRLFGRSDALADLAGRIEKGQDVTVATEPETFAVHGLGGIGKTALALEFCHLHRHRFSLIWWVNAETPTGVSESYRQLAHTLRIPYQSEEDARNKVVDHLRQRTNWLAVFDNAPDQDALAAAKPDTATGQIIATSRNPHGWANPLPLPPINDASAKEWILTAAGNPTTTSEIEAAHTLTEQLDGLALALAMATSFITKTGCSIVDYLGFYQADELLNNNPDVPTDYEESVFTTWNVSIEHLRSTNPEATRLLEYLAFCAPDQIPIRVFTPESLQTDPDKPVKESAINGAIRGLLDFSLVTRYGSHLWVHRLVQVATRYYLSVVGV